MPRKRRFHIGHHFAFKWGARIAKMRAARLQPVYQIDQRSIGCALHGEEIHGGVHAAKFIHVLLQRKITLGIHILARVDLGKIRPR